jgi:hypothetical protein
MTELRAWHRQPGESKQAYEAFKVYKNLRSTERSLPRVSSECTKSVSLIRRWSARWNWGERAQEWDEEVEIRELDARIESKKRMDDEHLKIVRTARNKAVQRLKDMDLSNLSPAELRAWLLDFIRLERLILGEPEPIELRRTKIEKADPASIEKEIEELLPIVEGMFQKGDLAPLIEEQGDADGDPEEGSTSTT